MKKLSVRLLAAALAAALLLSLAACSGNNASSQEASASSASSAVESSAASQPESSESISTAESASSSESASSQESSQSAGLYATVKEFAASKEVQQALESIKNSLDQEVMDVELVGEDARLIYNFSYKNLEGQDLTSLAASLTAALEADNMAETFGNIAKSLAGAVAVKDPTVVVNYLAPDGTLLAGKEFSAQ